jgi:protein-S-isoprenylcysteine O-methyltransferase Ste14
MIYLGILLLLTGFGIRVWHLAVLGDRFSEKLRVPGAPYETDRGLYGYIRHPMYLGSILMVAGMVALCAPLAIMYVTVVLYRQRLTAEEGIQLGGRQWNEYAEYMARVPGALLPKRKRR